MVIDNCTKEFVKPFVDTVNVAIENLKRKTFAAQAPVQSAPQQLDIASQLERLSALVEKGFLSKEEFETQKQKLLNA